MKILPFVHRLDISSLFSIYPLPPLFTRGSSRLLYTFSVLSFPTFRSDSCFPKTPSPVRDPFCTGTVQYRLRLTVRFLKSEIDSRFPFRGFERIIPFPYLPKRKQVINETVSIHPTTLPIKIHKWTDSIPYGSINDFVIKTHTDPSRRSCQIGREKNSTQEVEEDGSL